MSDLHVKEFRCSEHGEIKPIPRCPECAELIVARLASLEERESLLVEWLDKIGSEKSVCECPDQQHQGSLDIYDVAVRHIVRRMRDGIKMAPSCDGVKPNKGA